MLRYLVNAKTKNKKNLQRLNELNEKYKSGKNFQKRNGGYVVDGKHMFGITRKLNRKFYANYKYMERRRIKNSSSKKDGDLLHRHVFHKYTCKTPKTCICKERFGTKTRKLSETSPAAQRIKGLEAFLKKNQLKVYVSELIVGWKDVKTATAVDLICVDDLDNPNELVVVELKTGYDVQLNTCRTKDNSGKMMKPYCNEIDNTAANHHQLQLWFCVEALQKNHNVNVDNCLVLYLKHDATYKCIYGKNWWFKNSKMKEKLKKQLCTYISN